MSVHLTRVHASHGERAPVLGTCVGCVICWRVIATDGGRRPTAAGVAPCVPDEEMIALMTRCATAGITAGWKRGGLLRAALRGAVDGGRHAARA